MIISIYELLKLIKENKAPKEIEYDGYLLSWDNADKDYYCEEYGNLLEYLFGEYQTTRVLDITVKILEEKKIPEKLEIYKENNEIFLEDLCYKYMPIHKDSLSSNEQVIVDKLNEIIDYLVSKGE